MLLLAVSFYNTLMNTKPYFLTTAQAAEILQLHVVTVRRLLKSGQLPGIRVGGQWRLNPADLKPQLHEEVKRP